MSNYNENSEKENTSEEEVLIQKGFIEEAKNIIQDKIKITGIIPTYHVTTFGCQMNARDSEKLAGILEEVGYEYEEDEKKADFVLYNTCTVRENANQRLYGHLGTLGGIKKKRKDMIIGMCGCMMQEEVVRNKINESYPFVDLIFGTHNVYNFAKLLVKVLSRSKTSGKGHMITEIWEDTDKIVEDLPVKRIYNFKSGVNIMFGCNNFCSYCIVPYVRGRERSRKPEDIIAEIKKLVECGVKEIMLLGQNVNSYGKGLENEISFAHLLEMVEEIDGIERIRFMTSHPKDLSDDLIDVMAKSKKICKHIHLPLQSGSSRLLKDMNRHYTKDEYINLALKIRDRIPDVAITSDIIIGYPGETDDDVNDTIDVIERVQFDGAFTFIYSKRTGTPAAKMENQVPEDEAKKSFNRVLEKVQEVSVKRAMLIEGKVLDVLVEEVNKQDNTLVSGRLSNNLIVHFKGDESLIGSIVNVKLTECKGFYYYGEMC